MAFNKKILSKILKITGITVLISLAVLFILPIAFSKTITEQVRVLANNNLEGELNFKDSELSFIKNFPSLTLTLNDLDLKGSEPFKNKTLIKSKEVGFGINVWSLIFSRETQIDEIFINKAKINILVNRKGEANYNIYKSEKEQTNDSSESATLNLENIHIENSHLLYKDISTKINIEAKGFKYKGKGNLLESNFNLKTDASIDSLSLAYDGKEYLKHKKVKAKLLTIINTNSLSFLFEKNDLIINKLPVEFNGFFNFVTDGYDMDFNLKTVNSNLEDLFTALPAEYITWMQQTKMKGKTDASLTLKGKYIASKKISPELNFNLKVRDGFVQHTNAPFPIEKLHLNLNSKLPNLDINLLKIDIDTLNFDVNKNNLKAYFKSEGFGKKITIDSKIKSNLNLDIVNQALQIPNFKVGGHLIADIVAKGDYLRAENKFPIAKGDFQLTNGYIQTAYYPHPIEKINVKANLNSPSGYFKDASLVISPSSFLFEKEPFNVSASFKNFEDINYDIKAKGLLNISKIYKVFSKKGLDINGWIKADVELAGTQSNATNGNIHKLKNKGTLEVKNTTIKSKFLTKPFLIEEGLFTFNQDKMYFDNFKSKYGESDIVISGFMQNAIHFVLNDSQTLGGKFDLKSNYINVNDFFPTTTYEVHDSNEGETVITGVIEIPTNYNFSISANALKTQYNEIQIDNLKGNLIIQNGSLKLVNGSIGIIGATAKMDAFYKNEGSEKAHFEYKIDAGNFNIKRAYDEIKMFREIATAAEKAEGIVGLKYAIKGVFNNQMEPVMPSLEGGGSLTIKKVKIKGFKLLNVVSEKTNREGVKDPDISEVVINSTIKNNIINVERFKFKAAGMRLRFEGQTSLDGKLNLNMRIGLPPFGIIGIPIKITGTQDKPHIKLGKQTEELEETKYVDGITPINKNLPTTTIATPTTKKDSVTKTEPVVPVEKVE